MENQNEYHSFEIVLIQIEKWWKEAKSPNDLTACLVHNSAYFGNTWI